MKNCMKPLWGLWMKHAKTEEVDGIIIITEYDDNGEMIRQSFETKEQSEKHCEKDEKRWFSSVFDWLKKHIYVNVRDLADPLGDRDDPDKGQDGKNGYEIGVKWRF